MKAEIFVLGVCQQLTSGSYASMFFYADFNGYIYANAYTNTACRYYTIEQLRIVTIPPLVTPPPPLKQILPLYLVPNPLSNRLHLRYFFDVRMQWARY